MSALFLAGGITSCAEDESETRGETTGEHLGIAEQAATVAAVGDTYVELTTPNTNHGAEAVLKLQGVRQARSLVRFDTAAVLQAMNGWPLTTATLELTLASPPAAAWGTGHLVNVHRMVRSWTEGGATGVCPADVDLSDLLPDCPGTEWAPWATGGLPPVLPRPWATPATASQVLSSGQTGVVAFDVTVDVRAFLAASAPNEGWVIKTAEDFFTGSAAFASRETATPPRLVLVVGGIPSGGAGGSEGSGGAPPLDAVSTLASAAVGVISSGPSSTSSTGTGYVDCGSAVVDDGNECTDDACNSVDGVTHVARTGATCADDGEACTGLEACSASGQCTSAVPDGTLCCGGVFNVDPLSLVAIDPTVVTDFPTAVAPLYEGPYAQQHPDTADTILRDRVSVVTGMVVDATGAPLPCATITVVGGAEYGASPVRRDGSYAIALNGGDTVVIAARLPGYLPAYRQVHTSFHRYAHAQTIVLQSPGAAQPVSSSATSTTIVDGDVETDAQGTRSAALFFPPGTQASVEGEVAPRPDFDVTVTELTNLDRVGQDGMPASLPPNSAFTYLVSLAIDGAEDEVVTFNRKIPVYVENFLDFPKGTPVPVGRFDPATGRWITEPSGTVLRIVGVDASGRALIDHDEVAGADDPALIGMTDAERVSLLERYAVNQTLWRFSVDHFSYWDANWGFGPPSGATAPTGPDPTEPNNPNSCEIPNASTIECENQVLRESVPIAATPFELVYSSGRQDGSSRALNLSITGAVVPSILRGIDVEVEVGGRLFTPSIPSLAPNQVSAFSWDGRDLAGRWLRGPQPVRTRIGYRYDGSYQRTERFGYNGNGTVITGSRERFEVTLWQEWRGTLGQIDGHYPGLGGWTLDAHHVYDDQTRTVYLGDGTRQEVPEEYTELRTIAGTGVAGFSGDGGPATSAAVSLACNLSNSSLAVAADGTVYISDCRNHRVRRIDTSGVITTVAGGGVSLGDGGPATSAMLNQPAGVALAPDGSLYIADTYQHRVRRVDHTTGIITTVAGTGTAGSNGTLGTATAMMLNKPTGVAVDDDGTVFITDRDNGRIGRIKHGLFDVANNVSGATGVVVASDGTRYVSAYGLSKILRFGSDGVQSTWAGSGFGGTFPYGDGGHALNAGIFHPDGLAVGPDDLVYFVDTEHHLVRRVNADRTIQSVIGTGGTSFNGEGLPALRSTLFRPRGLTVGPDGSVYVVDTSNQRIRKTTGKPPSSDQPRTVASRDGKQLFRFDPSGRHLATDDAYSGASVYTFGYTPAGRLASVTDRDGRTTTIERDASGKATGITAPDGQSTVLEVSAGDELEQLVRPDGGVFTFGYGAGGLLTSMKDPKAHAEGGVASSYGYQDGRLVADTDAAGATQELQMSVLQGGWQVQHESALGRTRTYRTIWNGDQETRTVTHRDQTTSVATEQKDIRALFTGPDGIAYDQRLTQPDASVVYSLVQPGDAYGMEAPIVARRLTVLPSGLSRLTTRSEAVQVDPATGLILDETTTRGINGRNTVTTFDATTSTFSTLSPAGRTSSRLIDALGRTVRTQRGGLLPLDISYDTAGRVHEVARGSRVTTWTYAAAGASKGYVETVTDALSRTTSYASDALGRTLLRTDPDDGATAFAWDGSSNLTSLTPPGQPAHEQTFTPVRLLSTYDPPVLVDVAAPATTYGHNADRQRTSTTRPDGVITSQTYDTAGRPSLFTMPTGTVLREYFGATACTGCTPGRLRRLTGPGSGDVLSFTYNGPLLTKSTWAGVIDGVITWTHDTDFRTATEAVQGGSTVTYTYDPDGFTTCASPGACSPPSATALQLTHDADGLLESVVIGGLTETYAHNPHGELATHDATHASTPIYSAVYDSVAAPRDALGRITRKVETVGGTPVERDYEYDLRGRLYRVSEAGVLLSEYVYDENGNRLSLERDGETTFGAYDDQDRLLSWGDVQYGYTANGDIETRTDTATGDVTAYTYDARGALLEVDLPDGTLVEYIVDGRSRRIGKKVDGVVVQGFLYKDELRIAAELDGAGAVVSQFIHADEGHSPDSMVRGGVVYRIIKDQLGSVRLVVDAATGLVVQELEYDEFGVVLADSNPGFQPFGFAGGLYDPDTSLVRFGARDFDAETGRWVHKDPIRFDGGVNLYAYANNDPVNLVDRSGRHPEDGSNGGYPDGGPPDNPVSDDEPPSFSPYPGGGAPMSGGAAVLGCGWSSTGDPCVDAWKDCEGTCEVKYEPMNVDERQDRCNECCYGAAKDCVLGYARPRPSGGGQMGFPWCHTAPESTPAP